MTLVQTLIILFVIIILIAIIVLYLRFRRLGKKGEPKKENLSELSGIANITPEEFKPARFEANPRDVIPAEKPQVKSPELNPEQITANQNAGSYEPPVKIEPSDERSKIEIKEKGELKLEDDLPEKEDKPEKKSTKKKKPAKKEPQTSTVKIPEKTGEAPKRKAAKRKKPLLKEVTDVGAAKETGMTEEKAEKKQD